MNAVEIYESLFQFERSKDNSNEGYPIHKRMKFDESNVNDIYDWIIRNFDFKVGDTVLDAGCGVGYGSMKLAGQKELNVTGISISPSEVARAKSNAKQSEFKSNLSFFQKSFEEAPGENYNFIIAVESLKHSLDLEESLKALKSKLAPKGKIIIVEDFYQSQELTKKGRTLMKDWSLIDLFSLKDYSKILAKGKLEDLTSQMPVKSPVVLKFQQIFLSTLGHLPFLKKGAIYNVFRGGILLDMLYNQKLMKYAVYSWTETKEEC